MQTFGGAASVVGLTLLINDFCEPLVEMCVQIPRQKDQMMKLLLARMQCMRCWDSLVRLGKKINNNLQMK